MIESAENETGEDLCIKSGIATTPMNVSNAEGSVG